MLLIWRLFGHSSLDDVIGKCLLLCQLIMDAGLVKRTTLAQEEFVIAVSPSASQGKSLGP